jgi:hypothetical protein
MNLMHCKQLFVSMVVLLATVSWAQQSGLRAIPPLVPLKAGTPLSRCTFSASCPQGYNAVFFLFSDNFFAQPFSLTSAVHVDSILFVIANESSSGSGAGLPFRMQLTNSIGPGTAMANVLAEAPYEYGYPGTGQGFGQAFILPVNAVLGPGVYYLVASSSTPMSSSILGWPAANNVIAGDVPGNLTCNSTNGSCDLSFPPASVFVNNTEPPTPVEFQLR